MKSASLILSFVTFAAACGDTGEGGGPDAPPSDSDAPASEITTLDQLPYVGRIALAGDCLVATTGRVLTCVSLTGGASRRITMLEDRTFMGVVPDGDHVIFTSLSTTPDELMRVERATLAGEVTAIGSPGAIDATTEGQGLALAGDRVIVTADNTVVSFPKTGGAPTRHASDGGNFGEVAAVGNDAYYVNPTLIYRYDLANTGGRGTPIEGIFVPVSATLVADRTRAIAITDTVDFASTLVHVLPSPALVATVPGASGRAALRGDRAWVVAGMSIVEVNLTTGDTKAVVTGERAVDLVATNDALYWATADGRLRTRLRAP